jgi:ubiquinone/menaquinone biosynthesis C-methylase UbiE
MPPTTEQMQGYLDELGVTCRAESFIALVSNLYHDAESRVYDDRHRELADAAVAWTHCLETVAPALPASVRVLDVGAGTGFASLQVLRVLGQRVERLVCLDPSAAMLAKARTRLAGTRVAPQFVVGDLTALVADRAKFDLILTNSVLHHVPDVTEFLDRIRALLTDGGIYVAGHEPCREFFAHPELRRWGAAYRRWRRLRRLASPAAYRRFFAGSPDEPSIVEATNTALLERAVIQRPLPSAAIRRLIDIHVPSSDNASPSWAQHGLSRAEMLRDGLSDCDRVFETSYAHVKDARANMGPMWRAVDRWLRWRFPLLGSNFLLAVRRPGRRTVSPARA